jgi:histidyl-tRNA synthetase
MHREELSFPFKRYQIQPVWRADRPQKGRYREFYQCDADIIGNNSLINEVELIQLIDYVFEKLNIHVAIKLNNRKVLAGIADVIGEPEKIIDITVAIDKIDKIGLDGVIAELKSKEISDESIEKLLPILKAQGSNEEKMQILAQTLSGNAIGEKGVEELQFILDTIKSIGIKSTLDIDLTLARGLNYYTGAILEVKALDVAIGSITGGGRYDNLTGVFGMDGMSGVGISFGADRIYDVMNQLDLYPQDAISTTKVMFVNFGEKEAMRSLQIIGELRKAGISAELFPSSDKMKKQMGYANNKAIPFVAIIGEQELTDGTVALKNMTTGEQKSVTAEELKEVLA